jgi:hypothetical protein
MRGVLAPIPSLTAAMALAGCMGRAVPVAILPEGIPDSIGMRYALPVEERRV